jgi:hypothetical protein
VKCLVYFLISLAAWAICSAIIRWGYAIPMRGSLLLWFVYSSLFLLSIVALGQFFSAVMPNPIVATSISLVFTSLSGAEWLHLAHHCVACVLSENRAGLSTDAFCHRLSQCGIDGMWLFRSEKGAATSRRHHRGLPYAELRHLAAASEPH